MEDGDGRVIALIEVALLCDAAADLEDRPTARRAARLGMNVRFYGRFGPETLGERRAGQTHSLAGASGWCDGSCGVKL